MKRATASFQARSFRIRRVATPAYLLALASNVYQILVSCIGDHARIKNIQDYQKTACVASLLIMSDSPVTSLAASSSGREDSSESEGNLGEGYPIGMDREDIVMPEMCGWPSTMIDPQEGNSQQLLQSDCPGNTIASEDQGFSSNSQTVKEPSYVDTSAQCSVQPQQQSGTGLVQRGSVTSSHPQQESSEESEDALTSEWR